MDVVVAPDKFVRFPICGGSDVGGGSDIGGGSGAGLATCAVKRMFASMGGSGKICCQGGVVTCGGGKVTSGGGVVICGGGAVTSGGADRCQGACTAGGAGTGAGRCQGATAGCLALAAARACCLSDLGSVLPRTGTTSVPLAAFPLAATVWSELVLTSS